MIDWSDYPNFSEAEMLSGCRKCLVVRATTLFRVKRLVIRIAHNTKIVGAVIFSVAVDVVNCFAAVQRTTQHFFCYQPVFKNISLLRSVRMIWHEYCPVAHSFNFGQSSTLPGTYTAARVARTFHMLGSEHYATDDASPLVSLECSSPSTLAVTDLRTAYFAYRNERNKVDLADWASTLKAVLSAYKFPSGFCHV